MRRRGKVSASTMGVVSLDAWRLICANAYTCPHIVFRLLMVCKGIRDALRCVEPGWWLVLFRRVCAYQGGLRHSNTLRRLWTYKDPERGLRSVFAPQCEGCGTRKGHRLMRPYALRVCGRCLHDGIVSNLELELLCGLSFCDFLASYLEGGGFFLPMRAFASHSSIDALRRIAPEYDQRLANALVFLWRPNVERVLGHTLSALTQTHTERRRAALTLVAHVRRRLRTRAPPPLPWMPGGPYQLHTGRSRYAPEALALWEAQMAKAVERLQPYLSLRWLPDATGASI
jgi:hypothetical protein